LSIEQGRFTVLLGSSGAGKSTLLRTLNGLVRPSAGAIAVDGLGVLRGTRTMRTHRRATGMVFREMVPPDFSRWQHWLRPLLDTL
jgi:phosphonate transport system ATP-binding protein